MNCPFCNYEDTRVIDSRPAEEDKTTRRRRECSRCGGRFTTYERYEIQPIVIIKRDGRREKFRREKILNGLTRACEKRRVSLEDLNGMVSEIEILLQKRESNEINSNEIGELIMEKLKNIDQVAYVRFASVYKDFRDIDQFKQFVDELRKGGEF